MGVGGKRGPVPSLQRVLVDIPPQHTWDFRNTSIPEDLPLFGGTFPALGLPESCPPSDVGNVESVTPVRILTGEHLPRF